MDNEGETPRECSIKKAFCQYIAQPGAILALAFLLIALCNFLMVFVLRCQLSEMQAEHRPFVYLTGINAKLINTVMSMRRKRRIRTRPLWRFSSGQFQERDARCRPA